jgi:hypothetical protein
MLDPTISIKYMIAGYAVVVVVLPAYLVSLVLRWRTMKRKLRELEEVVGKK